MCHFDLILKIKIQKRLSEHFINYFFKDLFHINVIQSFINNFIEKIGHPQEATNRQNDKTLWSFHVEPPPVLGVNFRQQPVIILMSVRSEDFLK